MVYLYLMIYDFENFKEILENNNMPFSSVYLYRNEYYQRCIKNIEENPRYKFSELFFIDKIIDIDKYLTRKLYCYDNSKMNYSFNRICYVF